MNASDLDLVRQNFLCSDNPDAHRIATVGIEWLALMIRKNIDYGSNVWSVPCLTPHADVATAILVRMSDKIARLQSLFAKGNNLVDESIEDTLKDLGAYCLLYLARPVLTNAPPPTTTSEQTIFKTLKDILDKQQGHVIVPTNAADYELHPIALECDPQDQEILTLKWDAIKREFTVVNPDTVTVPSYDSPPTNANTGYSGIDGRGYFYTQAEVKPGLYWVYCLTMDDCESNYQLRRICGDLSVVDVNVDTGNAGRRVTGNARKSSFYHTTRFYPVDNCNIPLPHFLQPVSSSPEKEVTA